MRSSSSFILLTEDEKADGTNWRKKILFLLVCSLVVMMGLLVALIVVSVKLADKEDPILPSSVLAELSLIITIGYNKLSLILTRNSF